MYPGERCGVGQRVNWNNWKPQRGGAPAPQKFVDTSRPSANRYSAAPKRCPGAAPRAQSTVRAPAAACPGQYSKAPPKSQLPPRNPYTAYGNEPTPMAAPCPGAAGLTGTQQAARAANRAVNVPRARPTAGPSRYGQAALKAQAPPKNPFAHWGSNNQNNVPWARPPQAPTGAIPRASGLRAPAPAQGGYCPAATPQPPPCPAAVPEPPPPCPAAVPPPPPPGSLAYIQQRLEASRAATAAAMARAQASMRAASPTRQREYCPAAQPPPPPQPCPAAQPPPPPCPGAVPRQQVCPATSSARRPSVSLVPSLPQPCPAQDASRGSMNASRRSIPRGPPSIAQTSQRSPPTVSKTVFKQTTTKRLVPPAAKGNASSRCPGAGKKAAKSKSLKDRPAFDTGAPPPVVAVPVERVREPSLASFAPPLRRERAAAAEATRLANAAAAEAARVADAAAAEAARLANAAAASAEADAALEAFESRAAAQLRLLNQTDPTPPSRCRERTVTVPVANVAGCKTPIRTIQVPASVANAPDESIVSVSAKTGVARRVLDFSFEKNFGPSRPLKKAAELPPPSNALGQFLYNLEEADRIERRELGDTLEDIQRNRRRFLFMGLEGDDRMKDVNEYNRGSTSRTMWEERLRSEKILGSVDAAGKQHALGMKSMSHTRGVANTSHAAANTSRAAANRCPGLEEENLDEEKMDLVDSDEDPLVEEPEEEEEGITTVSKKIIYQLKSSSSEEEDEEILDDLYDELVDWQPQGLQGEELQGDDLFEWMRPIGAPLLQVTTTTSRTRWHRPGALMDVSPVKQEEVGEKPSEMLFRLIKLVDAE